MRESVLYEFMGGWNLRRGEEMVVVGEQEVF